MTRSVTKDPILRVTFIILVFYIIFFLDGRTAHLEPGKPGRPGEPRKPRPVSNLVAERLATYRHALDSLNHSRWGDFAPGADLDANASRWLNLTGFREHDGFAWEDLYRFREKGLQLSRHAVPPVGGRWLWETAQGEPLWTDAAGVLDGRYVRLPARSSRTFDSYNLPETVPAMDWVGHRHSWARNLTGDSGRIHLRLEGNKPAAVSRYDQLPADQRPLSGGSIRSVRGLVTVEDTHGSGFSWEMRLWGVHWPRQGVVLMATTSEKFDGIFGLPHLSPGPDFFQSSQRLLNTTIARVLNDKAARPHGDRAMPWNSDVDNPLYTPNPSPHCEFVLYAQIHPPRYHQQQQQQQQRQENQIEIEIESKTDIIRDVESEIDHPLGIPIRAVPELKMSTVVFSPDCAFFLESKGPPDFAPQEGDHLVGMKTQLHLSRVKSWVLAQAVVMFFQIYLLRNQINDIFSPSSLARVSFHTIGVMVAADGLIFVATAAWVSTANASFLPTLALLFAAFLVTGMGMQLLSRIYDVQQPDQPPRPPPTAAAENRTRTRTRDNDDRSSSTVSSSVSRVDTRLVLPPPVAPVPVPVPVRRPSDTPPPDPTLTDDAPIDIPNPTRSPAAAAAHHTLTFAGIVGRTLIATLVIGGLAVTAPSWTARIRSLFFNLLAAAYFSLWLPQIHRNAMRNCRRGLTWPFVLGQSATRILPIAYFWLKPDNFLYANPEPRAFAALATYLWLQVVVLALQDALGPRVGVPAHWTPDAWDYHPILRHESVEAGGLPIGLGAEDHYHAHLLSDHHRRTSTDSGRSGTVEPRRRGSSSSLEGNNSKGRAIDCAICREILEVTILRPGEEDVSVASVFARRAYMVTPCRHIFHTACLEGWMRFRLQCPICREDLPPL